MSLTKKEITYLILLVVAFSIAIIFAGLFGAQMEYRIKAADCTLDETGILDYWENFPFPTFTFPREDE